MKKVIIIRYGEIFLKGANRSFFEKTLEDNIKKSLKGIHFTIKKISARYILADFDPELAEELLDKISCVFGVHSVSLAYEVDSEISQIVLAAKEVSSKSGTFKVNTKRADKKFILSSYQVSAEVGHQLLETYPNLSVNVTNPQSEVFIDIRENSKTLVFSSIIKGVNGMPIGVGGNGLILLSGGIDSPVAYFMMSKRGMQLRALHFESFPYTSKKAKEKVIELTRLLKKYCINITLDVVSFTEIQTQIHEKCPENLLITIMRRFMMRIANKICATTHCGAIVTGESLGQVASQTLESIICTNSVAEYPVFRPLIGMDKDEIIEIARKINTFETSIMPYEDCCTIFLPKNPATKPNLEAVRRAEALLDIDTLIENALATKETYFC